MSETPKARTTSTARTLAIGGGLITGVAGIFMAVYSVMQGEETGAGALLAASAVAFGFLASNLERGLRRRSHPHDVVETGQSDGRGPEEEVATKPAAVPAVEVNGSALNASRGDGDRMVQQRGNGGPQVDAEPITQREREVLSLVAEGYSNKLISVELGISERTVKSHLTSTMGKLRASDRTHAVVTAIRLGWLDL